jgi:imidazolonepropionase-like amidohydrolase
MRVTAFRAALFAAVMAPVALSSQDQTVRIRVAKALDGTGKVLSNVTITIQGSKITSIGPDNSGAATYNLGTLTAMPGMIDVHAHVGWHFDKDGRYAARPGTPAQEILYSAENAYVTLLAGFTTIQSPGQANDVELREGIARGVFPGPRILTAVEPLLGRGAQTGTPEELRAYVRKQKEAGADLIKIYASGGFRQGSMTLSQEQLNAACDEARKLGLHTLVHAFRDAVHGAVIAGCTQVEHGFGATDDDLKLMARKGVYLDPQAGLVMENYLENKSRFLGTPGFNEESFAAIHEMIPAFHEFMHRAIKVRGLRIVFGSDALAGSHGRNAEEFIDRVKDGGVDPMAAMVSANSLGAEALGMSNQIGTIVPGLQADIIAGHVRHQRGQRGLARAGRPPQDHRVQLAALDRRAQDPAGAQQMLLADDLVERLRPHAIGQRPGRRGSRRAGRLLEQLHGAPQAPPLARRCSQAGSAARSSKRATGSSFQRVMSASFGR